MAEFSQINEEGIVQQVIIAEQEFIDSGAMGDSSNWVQGIGGIGSTSGGFPAGTKMLFHQTASPTGWTKLTQTGSTPVSFDDCGLRMVTGTITDGVAGSVAFDTAFASQTIPSHTLTSAEIPAHVHGQMGTSDGAQGQSGGGFTNRAAANGADTGSTGGGGSHGHGSIDMNVKYIDMIVASKD